MLEDKSIGLKIALNPEEAFWIEMKEKCLKEINNNKREIIINEAVIELAEKKIKEINEAN
jgi:hypothetical protein